MQFCLAGEAVHGDAHYVEDGIVAIGEDVLLFRPDLNLLGVFDGAGGATDIGRADIASQTAAKAIVSYMERARDSGKQADMGAALQSAREIVTHTKGAGLTTGLFLQLEPQAKGVRIAFAAAGDCAAGVYPDPVFDDRKYDDVLWFAGDQSDHFGDPTNFIGTEKGRVKRASEDQYGEVIIPTSKERWLFLSTDGVTGSFGIMDGIDEADIEYAFTYKHDVVSIAQALLNPPLQRETRRKVDDKSLIVLSLK